MRNHIACIGLAVVSHALDIEETLKEHVFKQQQQQPEGDGLGFTWTGDFTQANCDKTNPYNVGVLPGYD